MKSVVFCISLLAAAFAAGCGQRAQDAAQTQASDATAASEYVAPDAKGVETMTVKETAVPEYLDLPAHIEADPTRVVRVFAPAGGRITEMKVRPWDHAEIGQTLALIESGDLARSVADYHKALADYKVKQQQLDRATDLYNHHAISERDFQQAQGDEQIANSEVQATREEVQVFGMDPDHATKELRVTAARSGVILDVGASPGEFSKSLDAPAPLCTIADIHTVWALGEIYEKDLAATRLGEQAKVTLNAYPNDEWAGHVSVVSGAVDPVTRTLRLRVVLDNPGEKIKPQMFGRIRVLKSSAAGIVVPASAVVREGSDAYVFVGKGNNRFERRNVTLGRVLDGTLEVTGGLRPGDTIVSEGALLLRAVGQS